MWRWIDDIEWGTVPDVVTAVATTLGFLFGLLLLRAQLRAHQQAEADRKLGEKERRERHVRAVGVIARPIAGTTIHVRVSNDFPAPIQNCYVKVYGLHGQLGDPILLGTVEQGGADGRKTVPRGQRVTNAEVLFRDSAGLYWRKTMQGDYEEVASSN